MFTHLFLAFFFWKPVFCKYTHKLLFCNTFWLPEILEIVLALESRGVTTVLHTVFLVVSLILYKCGSQMRPHVILERLANHPGESPRTREFFLTFARIFTDHTIEFFLRERRGYLELL